MRFNRLTNLLSKQSRSLRIVLVLPFLLQIFAAVGIVGYLSFRNGQKAVNEVADQLHSEIANRVEQYLLNSLQIPHQINRLNAEAMEDGLLDGEDVEALQKHFWRQIRVFDTVSYIQFGSQQQDFVGVGRNLEGGLLSLRSDRSTNYSNHFYALDDRGDRSIFLSNSGIYDPRVRPWYLAATEKQAAAWGEIYQYQNTEVGVRVGLTAVHPVYNPQGSLLGVLGVEVTLSQISDFLQSLEVGQSGQTFVMERSGLFIASSTPETPFLVKGDQDAKRFTITQSRNALIRATAEHLTERFQDFHTIQTAQKFEFQLNGERHFIQVLPVTDSYGIDWLIVVVLPEADFMTQIHHNTRSTLILCLIALGIATAIGWKTSRWIVKPIRRLTLASQELAHGKWEQQLEVERADEVGVLAQSFQQMSKQLQTFFTTLEQQNQELQRLDQLKDEFLANTSHELRTPLHGIMGLAESLIDGATGSLSSQTRSNLAMIVSSSQRLSNLVDDLLDFFKIRHNSIQLQLKAVGLREIVDVVITLSQPLIGRKPLKIINQISPDLPAAEADENRLQQILYNLIGNAIKFTDSGTIILSANLEESSKLVITIADTGIGIPKDKFTSIFESFEQADGSTARQYGGTGLGLAVTKKLVELHGGQIWVESTVGEGSKFTFTLPVSFQKADLTKQDSRSQFQSPPILSEPESTPETPKPLAENSAGGLTILIVDDEPINLQVLINHLSLNDYAIAQANNGVEALEMIEEGLKPDLILLDVMMPRMTGYEVCRKLREKFSANELPVVMLTAKNQSLNLVEGFNCGANDYLTKPISKIELLARIKTHIKLSSISLQNADLYFQVQEREQRFKQFLNAIPVGIVILDSKGHLYYFNERAEELLGKGIVPDVALPQIPEIYQLYLANTNQFYPYQKLALIQALQGENQSRDDIEIRRSDKTIPIESWGTSIRNQSGEVIYSIVAFQDITERKKAEAERLRFTDELFQLNQAFSRFVPRQFLQFLHKESIVDVQFGDQVQKEMTVMFSDIRNFTSFSERLTPQETFKFVNGFLSRMEPIIIENNGFIDKYIGDAIMALFVNANEALQAAITMLQRLVEYNLTRQRPQRSPINIGIGLHTGLLMLGTVGGHNRMDTTVISDAVNLASRVEGLTKMYGASLLITEDTYQLLENPQRYAIREIDRVAVKGKIQPVTIYEVLEGDNGQQIGDENYQKGIDLKKQTQPLFNQGLKLYRQQSFQEAKLAFEEVLSLHREDKAVQLYLQKINHFLEHGMPENWDGVWTLKEK